MPRAGARGGKGSSERNFYLDLRKLLLYLRGFAACPGNVDVGEIRILGGTVPVFLTSRKQNNIPGGDYPLLLFSCHDALARRNNEDLIALMDVELVSDAPAEVDDVHVVVPAFGDQLLYGYLFAGEERAFSGNLRNIIHTHDMHFDLLH
jgi:hypothetical protein